MHVPLFSLRKAYHPPQSLIPYVLLAILVHVAFITALKFQPNTKQISYTPFEVRIFPSKSKPMFTIPTKTNINTKNRNPPALAVKHVAKNWGMRKILTPIKNTMGNLPTTEGSQTTPPAALPLSIENPSLETKHEISKLSTETLLESASRIAKEDALNMPKEKVDNIALADRAYSPKLAKVLAQKKASTNSTQYASGMIKVVSANGTEYCLMPPPASTIPTGAFESASMPMACP